MGNRSNIDQWAAMERLRFVERSAYWRGTIQRQDLAAAFGLSMAQASADLQKYQEVNSGALLYNLNRKRYEGAERMPLKLTEHCLEDAMGVFLSGGAAARVPGNVRLGALPSGTEEWQVQVVRMPERGASPQVERKVFLAIYRKQRLRVRYLSVHSGSAEWRWLRPRVFAHDGNRWHVRAWCENDLAWKDFTLSRMVEAGWPEEDGDAPPLDKEMAAVKMLRVRPHRGLNEAQRRAVEVDFGMVEGEKGIPTTEALENYLRVRLGLPLRDGTMPPLLVEEVGG